MHRTTSRDALVWDDVRLFLALYRSSTVGAAAAVMGVDASTVSRRLVTLERAVGASLFDRGRDGITVTKAGEDLLAAAERMEDAMTSFATAADGLEREVSGVVRITSPPDVVDVVLTPLLPELFARHPALRVELEPGEALLDLTRREADLALRTVRPTRGELLVTRLTTVRWVLVASAPVARALGTLQAFHDAPWVSWGERLAELGPARWLAKHAREVDPVVRSDSLMVQLRVVSAGVGVALVPERSAKHYGLVPVKLDKRLREAAEKWPSNDLFLVTHRTLRDVPRVRVIWELLTQRVGDRPTRP